MGFFKRLFGKSDSKQKTTKKEVPRKYHVSLNKDKNSESFEMWRVRMEQSEKTIKYFETQQAAIDYAETLADESGSSVVIHKKDGTIR
jgi:uncharacterized protein YdaT